MAEYNRISIDTNLVQDKIDNLEDKINTELKNMQMKLYLIV